MWVAIRLALAFVTGWRWTSATSAARSERGGCATEEDRRGRRHDAAAAGPGAAQVAGAARRPAAEVEQVDQPDRHHRPGRGAGEARARLAGGGGCVAQRELA